MFTGRGTQLTVFVGESDLYHHGSLYMSILQLLRREGCSGATAIRGIAGFGVSTVIHTSNIVVLSADMPVVIVAVDRPERISRVLLPLKEMAPDALITLEDVEIVQSGASFKEGLPDVTVGEVMKRDVVTVHPDSPITEVVELLLDKDFTALPVVDDGGRVVGIISDNDLLTRAGMNISISLKRATDPDFVRELHQSLQNPKRKVAEVMTREVVTVSPETLLGRAARVMVDRHLKRLPVVDEHGKLLGILGRLDVLNTIAAVHLPQWHPQALSAGAHSTVGDVMSHEVPTVRESATLEDVFGLLVSSSHKRVVVVDSMRHVVGIIADSDLISRVSRENWPGIMEILVSKVPIESVSANARKHIQKVKARSAKELMSADVVTVRVEMPVASALAVSAEKRVKRLPVVNGKGELVGIVGRTELMRGLLSQTSAESPGE